MKSTTFAVAGLMLTLLASAAGAQSLPHSSFVDALDQMMQNDRLVDYDIRTLSPEMIDVDLLYSGEHDYSDEELAPFNNGVCFAMLTQAVQAGLRPFTGGTDIRCAARQQAGERADAGPLGVSRYQQESDDFRYQSLR